GLGLGESGRDAPGEGDLLVARGEDAVDDRDLVRVNAHLALKAETERGARRGFKTLRVGQIDPDRIERRLDPGGAGSGDDLGAGWREFAFAAAPDHVDVEREVAGPER